jgi:hypothetical protein
MAAVAVSALLVSVFVSQIRWPNAVDRDSAERAATDASSASRALIADA